MIYSGDALDAQNTFEEANALYEKGQYSKAVSAYETLVRQGDASPAIYFNLGNACFKEGQIGYAIVNYKRAADLAPRDPDIARNLAFARNSIGKTASTKPSLSSVFFNTLTLDELTLITAAAIWICFVLLVTVQLRPSSANALKRPSQILGAVSVVLALWLISSYVSKSTSRSVIVVEGEAVVRFGPLDESQSIYTANDGTELAFLDRKDDWVRVKDSSGRSGWIREDKILVLEGF